MFEIIQTKLINKHYNNLMVGYFEINNTMELFAEKYYWPSI